MSLRIRDLFRDGNGSAEVSLFGIVPLDRGEPSQELNEAELVRYLAEATWSPTALLPSEVVWHLSDGDFEAWQGQLTEISYDRGGRRHESVISAAGNRVQ